MLAAIPDKSQTLELIRIILTLVGEQSGNIPVSLKQHLLEVIKDARHLADNPQAAGIVSPEAIELAVAITHGKDLETTLRGVTTFESIDAALARRLLSQMDTRPA